MQAARWDEHHVATTLTNDEWFDTFFRIKIVQAGEVEEGHLLMNALSRSLHDVLVDFAGVLTCKGGPRRPSIGAYIEGVSYITVKSCGSHTVFIPKGSINFRACNVFESVGLRRPQQTTHLYQALHDPQENKILRFGIRLAVAHRVQGACGEDPHKVN